MEQQKIILITGLSGSGKSTAIRALEDVGYFCVDNLPLVLLPKFLEIRGERPSEMSKLAFVMDIRQKAFVSGYADVLENLGSTGHQFEILFLEASEEELVKRYSQGRRRHPLAGKKGPLEGIRAEEEQLKGLRAVADKVIDTSHYNVHELKGALLRHVLDESHTGLLEVHVLSFGFKYGIPYEADLVVDVRFLPNPHFIPELRELDGTSPQVEAFVNERDETHSFLKYYLDLLEFLIPLYEREGKSYLTIAVGCTGGKHRSIVVARAIFRSLQGKLKHLHLTHRDIELT